MAYSLYYGMSLWFEFIFRKKIPKTSRKEGVLHLSLREFSQVNNNASNDIQKYLGEIFS